MGKIIISLTILIALASQIVVNDTSAQSSSTWRTRVGNPPTSGAAPGEVPPYPSDIRSALISQFNVTINGFDQQHQQWIWELVWEKSNTKFPQLISGLVTQATNNGISYQSGCDSPSVYLGQYAGADFFKFIATHEFAHYIQKCKSREEHRLQEAINAMVQEGAVSWYGANGNPACFSETSNFNENHADIITYYLHPNAGLSSGPRNCVPSSLHNPPNPFFSGQTRFPIQLNVAKSILEK